MEGILAKGCAFLFAMKTILLMETIWKQNGYKMDTKWKQNGNKLDTQYSKDKNSKDKNSKEYIEQKQETKKH